MKTSNIKSTASAADRFFDTSAVRQGLKGRSIRGGAITFAAQGVKFVTQASAMIVLARLLDPGDFGVVAATLAIIGVANMFKDFGLAMATIQREQINHQQVSTLFWFNVTLGATLTAIGIAISPLVGWFYKDERMIAITTALALNFLLGGLTVQHQALLRRQMHYRALATIDVTAVLTSKLAAIVAALCGWGYWSLVLMPLTLSTVNAIGVWLKCGWRPGAPVRGSGVRPMLAFGGNMTGFSILNYTTRRLDQILIGRYWGAAALGFYTKAYELLLLPIQQINTPLTSVAVPVLSRLQDDPARFRAYYARGILIPTSLGMPAVVFMFVTAHLLVPALLTDRWAPCIPIFRIFGVAALAGTFNMAAGWVFVSLNRTDKQLRWQILMAIVVATAFLLTAPHGTKAIAAAWSGVTAVMLVPGLLYTYHGTPIRMRDLGGALWRPFTSATGAGLLLHVVNTYALGNLSLWPRLFACVACYGVFYPALWLLLPGGRRMFRELTSMLGELRKRSEAPKSP